MRSRTFSVGDTYELGRMTVLLSALIFLSHQFTGSATVNLQDFNDYVVLASDVQDYNGASSVFIIFAENDESLSTTTLMLHLHREFSRKQVLSLTASYKKIIDYSKIYYKQILRPLFVVLLNNQEEVATFENTTRMYDMSYPLWLIIFTNPRFSGYCSKRPRGNLFNLKFDSLVLVKCSGDRILREWYSVHGTSTEIYELAVWDPVSHLSLKTDRSLYERRQGIAGQLLRIATVNESPFIESQSGSMLGLFGKILQELSWSMNFTYISAFGETAYGIKNPTTGIWTGVMGRLIVMEADIGVAEFTMTGQRLDEVDFTLPLILSRNRLYMRPPGGSVVQWSSYHRAFSRNTWITLVMIIILSSLVITFIRMKVEERSIPAGHISENYLCVWGIFCQQGLSDFPSASALRIAYFSLFVGSVILLAIYSASLISFLTVSIPSLPFKDLKGFVRDGSYKLLTYLESADYDMLQTSNDRVIMKMKKLMKSRHKLPKTVVDGFQQTCREKNIAFYATEAVKDQINAILPCKLVFIESGRLDSLGLVLTKGSQYTGVMNYHLQKFKDCGIMTRLKKKYLAEITSTSIMKHNPVTLRGIVPLLTILAIGITFGLLIFFCEKIIHHVKYTEREKQSKKRVMALKSLLLYERHLNC